MLAQRISSAPAFMAEAAQASPIPRPSPHSIPSRTFSSVPRSAHHQSGKPWSLAHSVGVSLRTM